MTTRRSSSVKVKRTPAKPEEINKSQKIDPYDRMKPVGELVSLSYSATKGCVLMIEMIGHSPTSTDITAATTGADTCSGSGNASSAVTCTGLRNTSA